jgi:hypothetical protein
MTVERKDVRTLWALLAATLAMAGPSPAQEPGPKVSAGDADFFESRVRPLLADRCYECHSTKAAKLKGNLLLDTREGTRKGGDQGPAFVPGDPDRSLLVQAVRWDHDDLKMPPKKKLAREEIAVFEEWIRRGAPDPRTATPAGGVDVAKARRHWAFQPVKDPPVPAVRAKGLLASPLDAFLLAELEKRGMSFSPPAEKPTLLRRVTYDLTGLPPTPEEIEAFQKDTSPGAYERVVDRLLASPHYGERWGRHWLDVARYADTKGYVYADREESRFVHSHVYRDWVVRAFNEDVPFDRFLALQVAADRMVGEDKSDLAAMGFLTVGRRFINNIHDIIDDRIDTLGRGMMALTLSCARCHDHKFDPVPTADYYSLYGVFLGSGEKTVCLEPSPKATPEYAAFAAELQKRQDALQKLWVKKRDALLERLRTQTPMYLAAVTQIERYPTEEFYTNIEANDVNPVVARAWHAYIFRHRAGVDPVWGAWHAFQSIPEKELALGAPAWMEANGAGLVPEVAALFATAPATLKEVAERYGKLLAGIHAKKDAEGEALRNVLYGVDSPIALPPGAISEVEWFFDEGTRVELGKAQRAIDQLLIDHPAAPPHAAILEDRAIQHNPRVFRRGNPANKGEEVARQYLAFFSGPKREPFTEGSGRLELARAIASAENPLTARVYVNRAWIGHFGAGLVRTPSDFGLRSEPPTHPELLDYLSKRFVEGGWSVKKLHRLILLSNAYAQSSGDDPAFRAIDPENRLLWRYPRRRLDFEQMRDSFLAASGELDLSIGGKPQPFTGSKRRALYGFIDRLNVPGLLRAFDFASVDAHSPQRYQTTVPQQALFLMNSAFIIERSRAVAKRVEGGPDARIRGLYRLLFGREPDGRELAAGLRFLEAPEAPPVVYTPGVWQYGWGEVDEKSQKVKEFHALTHFTGSAWQGGPAWPDPSTGWVQLTALGGHAGNDLQHAAIRRWSAPQDLQITISGTVQHKPKEGNGVRARIVSSRMGEIASWNLKTLEAEMSLRGLEVKKDETLDFVVDCRGDVSFDEFLWAPVITPAKGAAANGGTADGKGWNAAKEFGGPPPAPMRTLERYAQALLLTNEFMFLD